MQSKQRGSARLYNEEKHILKLCMIGMRQIVFTMSQFVIIMNIESVEMKILIDF